MQNFSKNLKTGKISVKSRKHAKFQQKAKNMRNFSKKLKKCKIAAKGEKNAKF